MSTKLRDALNSAATISAYPCSASSHFVGLLAKLAHEYDENIEIETVDHIALYKNELILFYDKDNKHPSKVFHFTLKVSI